MAQASSLRTAREELNRRAARLRRSLFLDVEPNKILASENMINQNRLGCCLPDHNKTDFLFRTCCEGVFHLWFSLHLSSRLTTPASNSLKKVGLSLNRTNPPELKGIVSEFRPLTHLCLTLEILRTQDGRSALAETNPPSLSAQTCGLGARGGQAADASLSLPRRG